MSCVYLYAYTEQNAVWCNMKACIVFMWCWFERNKKKYLTLKLRIVYYLVIQSFLACLIVYIYIHVWHWRF